MRTHCDDGIPFAGSARNLLHVSVRAACTWDVRPPLQQLHRHAGLSAWTVHLVHSVQRTRHGCVRLAAPDACWFRQPHVDTRTVAGEILDNFLARSARACPANRRRERSAECWSAMQTACRQAARAAFESCREPCHAMHERRFNTLKRLCCSHILIHAGPFERLVVRRMESRHRQCLLAACVQLSALLLISA